MRAHPVLIGIAVLIFSVASAAPLRLTLAQLDTQRDQHHEKAVEVAGTVEKFEQKTSRAGNAYFVFVLSEGKLKVNAFGQGQLVPPLKDGDQVRLVGIYRKEKKVGARTYSHEIDVTKRKDQPYGIYPRR